jgi:branched-chain amino acid aminotransferase
MAPSAFSVTPPQGVKTSALTGAAVPQKIIAGTTLQQLDASKLKFTKSTTPITVPIPADPTGDATIAAANQ